MSKIKKITVSNLKAVSALSVDFNGCTAIITGGNNKGKSSLLRSLPERLRGVKPDMILKEGEKEGFAEWELTTGEKFVWNFDGKKEKLVFISDRNIKQSVTKELSTMYFPPVFDVDEFLNSAPAKQRATLQKLTGIDFSEIDRLYKAAYEDRTFANRKLAEEKAKLQPVDNKLPIVPLPTEELETELSGIETHNLKYKTISDKLTEKEKQVSDYDAEIKELEAKISSIREKQAVFNTDIEAGKVWIATDTNKPKTNEADLKEQIAKIREENILISENNKARLQEEEYNKAERLAQEADEEVKRIEAEKLDVIKNASLPDGFGFSDDGITYNGYAFNKDALSSSGIYIAALKLAAIGLGDVKSLHFDASFLDKNSLAEIEVWAKENNLQLLIERPDFEGGEIEYQIISE